MNSPTFFVPAATPENQENVFANFAKACHRPVPPPNERIYSITFTHNGEVWVATVGERLRGTVEKETRRKGKLTRDTVPLADPAIVLAIFGGSPYFVVTNHNIAGSVGSAWENPFMAGRPKSVTYFAP